MTSIVHHVYVDSQPIAVPAANPAVAVSPRLVHTGGAPALTSTEGNNTTPVMFSAYVAEIHVPDRITITGVALLNGDAVAGNVTLGIYNAQGNFVGKSASTAQASTDAYQRVPLALTLTRGTYYVAVQFDDTDARFRSHVFGGFGAGRVAVGLYGAMPSGITLPTSFTTAVGPIASLY